MKLGLMLGAASLVLHGLRNKLELAEQRRADKARTLAQEATENRRRACGLTVKY